MADTTIVNCPNCKARLKVPVQAKGAVRCPKCQASVRLEPEVEEVEEVQEVVRTSRVRKNEEEPAVRKKGTHRRDEDEGDEDRPRRSRRTSRYEDDDDDDRPRARRRGRRADYEDEDDDDDYEDRPRRKKNRQKQQPSALWLAALGAWVACLFLGFLIGYGIYGNAGLPADKDGDPVNKAIGLGVMILACLVLLPFGLLAVRNRKTWGRWGVKITGTTAVVIGFIQSIASGGLLGFALYGGIFWR